MRLSTTRRPSQSTDRPLEPSPTSSRLSSTLSTSRSERSLRTVASAGTRVGSTSARPWATSSSGSNPSVQLCGRSTSDRLPSGGLTKNSSSFSTPTATREEIQSVNHQPTPLCQPSGALFSPGPVKRHGIQVSKGTWVTVGTPTGGDRCRSRRLISWTNEPALSRTLTRSLHSFTWLCEHYGISRKTGYEWLDRWRTHGPEGLRNRSSRPMHCPWATPPDDVTHRQ